MRIFRSRRLCGLGKTRRIAAAADIIQTDITQIETENDNE
ncbi:hypothetical protein HNQ56_002048 [Anaerotaenia torta]